MNQSYILEDEWKIIESGFEPDRVKGSESIFSIGNGAMGQRANFEEQYSGPTFQGSYIGGVYYPDKTKVGWWKNGYPEYFAKVLNAPNWIGIDLIVNQVPIDLFAAKKINHFTRELDMKTGLYTRTFDLEMSNGVQLRAEVKRFLSMVEDQIGAIDYNIELLSDRANFNIAPYVSGNVKNEDSNWEDPFWNHLVSKVEGKSAFLSSQTLKTQFNVCTFMHTDINLNEKTLSGSSEEFNQENKLGYKTEVELHKGDRLSITKYGGYVSSLNHKNEDLESVAKQLIKYATKKDLKVFIRRMHSAGIKYGSNPI